MEHLRRGIRAWVSLAGTPKVFQAQVATRPPSTAMVTPLIKLASSLAR